ncbi:MAG: hypothetical protein HQL51_15495 [Magnetococcales bacterium]|nr:hypothetical protein [Magnetococcales bacterium]
MEQAPLSAEQRKRINRAGVLFFLLALVLIAYLTNNFVKQYDPQLRQEQKAQKQREAMGKSAKN